MTTPARSLELDDLSLLAQAHLDALAQHGICGVWACLVLDRLRRLQLQNALLRQSSQMVVDALAARWRGATNVELADVTAVLGAEAEADLQQYRPEPAYVELAASAMLHALQLDGFAGVRAVLALDRLDLLRLNAEHEFATRTTYRALGALWSRHSSYPLPEAFRTIERQHGPEVIHIGSRVERIIPSRSQPDHQPGHGHTPC